MSNIDSILDNQKENTLDPETPVMKEKEIDEEVREFTETIEGLTGGTTSEPSPVVYTVDDWDRATESASKCLDIMGEGEEDSIINLGAPEPHLSAISFRDGSQSTGASVLNESFEDITELNDNFRELLENAEEATCLIGLPAVTYALGRQLEKETGEPPSKVFPNLEKGFFGGEVLDRALKEDIRDQWDFDDMREFYAASEVTFLAAAPDESRKMIPLLDDYILEVRTEEGEIIDITELEEQVYGRLLITDTERGGMKLVRYDIGDRVEVVPENEIPKLKVLGRDHTCMNIGGAMVYEDGINEAVRAAHTEDEVEWRAEKGRRIDEMPPAKLADSLSLNEDDREWLDGFEDTGIEEFVSHVFDFFASGEHYEVNSYLSSYLADNPPHSLYVDFYLPQNERFDNETFLETLYENSPAFEEVEGRLGVVKEVNIKDIDDYPTEEEGLKAQRVKDSTEVVNI